MSTHSRLDELYAGLGGAELLRPLITQVFAGKIALVSSFGAEAAVLTHMVAQIDPATPVLFVDTKRLFPETLAYRDALIKQLKLSDVRTYEPSGEAIARHDPDATLFERDADACCDFRKIEPMERALRGFTAWISGRKRYHGADRAAIPTLEAADWRLKINPLADWGPAEIAAYFEEHELPRHPLVAQNYLSIGCMPCTTPVKEGEDPRAGRWRGSAKTECGIHFTHNGEPIRAAV